MTAYDLSEKKNKIMAQASYLEAETHNDAGTVLLTNDEVMNIVEALNECLGFINDKLKTVPIS